MCTRVRKARARDGVCGLISISSGSTLLTRALHRHNDHVIYSPSTLLRGYPHLRSLCLALGYQRGGRGGVCGRRRACRVAAVSPSVVLLSEDHLLEVGPLQSRAEAWLLQQLEHAQAMREDNVVAVLFARPVSKVVDVLKEGWVVKVAILRQVCKRAGARLRVLGGARVG